MDARVALALRDLETYMRSRDDALNIPRAAGEFVYALLCAAGPKRGVEIGTSYGYSALWAGAAIARNGGHLITIDAQPHKHTVATKAFADAGLDQVIECRTARALDALDKIESPIDYVLIDADKPNCIAYVEKLADRLALRAVVLTDNTMTHQQELAPYCAWIRARGDFASTNVPIGNGMEMSVYVGRA